MDHVSPQHEHDALDADRDSRAPAVKERSGKRGAFAALALVAMLACAALGIWQIERRAWKHELIARVESRIHAPSQPVPAPAAWPRIDARDDEYRRVRATGVLRNDRETLVQAVTELGPGSWVMTPLETSAGTILVNRGFVPPAKRDPATRREAQSDGPVVVTGLLRASEPGGGFLRANDPAQGRWYSRDVAAIARARALGPVAPFFIDADAKPNPGGYPVGGLTVVSFRDPHLLYALTWFALAALSAAAALLLLRDGGGGRSRRARKISDPAPSAPAPP